MAYIYQYHLKDLHLRQNINLVEYKEDIQLAIEELFNLNLKDCTVEIRYFEFKLYTTVPTELLRKMGRKLKSKLYIKNEKYGFIRREQILYALAYPSKDNNEDYIHIEFIDFAPISNSEKYMERAYKYFEETSRNSLDEREYDDIKVGVIKNYYLDVLDAYVDKNVFVNSFGNIDDISCFLVKGYHRRYYKGFERKGAKNTILLEKCFDAKYVEGREQIDWQGDNKSDYLEIHKIEADDEKIGEIKKEFNLLLPSAERIYALDKIRKSAKGGKHRNYRFRVYNVGQALATSLSLGEDSPFLYIDYGIPFGRNAKTKPGIINMVTKPKTAIILTHVHKDHWFRIVDDINAYRCDWYIPNQIIQKKAQLKHKFAEVIAYGGSVSIINRDIDFGYGKIISRGVSKINPSRAASHVHETGLTVRIEAYNSDGKDLNILIAGDQRYDYIEKSQLKELDILVASHHGGTYCWSTRGCIPDARNENSTVIYCYGNGNTHGHPSKTSDYVASNWKKDYHTSISGDFEIIISL